MAEKEEYYGYAGTILRVNLTKKEITKEPFPREWMKQHIGGEAVGAKIEPQRNLIFLFRNARSQNHAEQVSSNVTGFGRHHVDYGFRMQLETKLCRFHHDAVSQYRGKRRFGNPQGIQIQQDVLHGGVTSGSSNKDVSGVELSSLEEALSEPIQVPNKEIV